MITNRQTAKLVRDTLKRVRVELGAIHGHVEETCPPNEFATYNKALSRILDHFDSDILQPIYRVHPDLLTELKQ